MLLIEKYEDGVVSKYVHERLKGPIVKFPYKGTLRHFAHNPSKEMNTVCFSSFFHLFSRESVTVTGRLSFCCVGEQRTSLRT